ncbi:hypothetical protein [Brevibacterium casei]|uniref:Uncharacterized protein n=1 Tax=Brevibacterium casei TaxID=33889 RepID=A0AB34XMN8_9MICO|nr:hypothetical protein [Brevibacterium casei]KZE11312.1 hypothetical protein AVW13_16620 [Brevibacterium casei]
MLSRYICPTDRRGVYTDVSPEERVLLKSARPTNDTALGEALDQLASEDEFAPLIDVLRA